MKSRRYILAALALLGSLSLHAAASRPYTMLYVFGDSYSDTGAGFVDSDGPTAVAYLAERLHIPFTYFGDSNSKGKGLNFSVSGGKTGEGEGHGPRGAFFGRGLRNQVDDFAALVRSGKVKFDPAQTMFYFAGGLNDRGSAEGYTVTNIEGEIETLYALGARRFEVALLPVAIPVFATAGTQFNPGLAGIPAEMRARHPDIQIANSQWGPYFDEVMTHPAKYGITETVSPCVAPGAFLGSNICATPATHYYYYSAHPSTAVHKAVGEMLYREATQ
ncbi:Phospholipase/lecithinase/hemolysin [Granulicella rosea]|uniref:Phospholipase/lecithinase/hemolysin n=1 Tax=Granulicella rosea TaxID=474952 RepID=A0A239LP05_9BACT|nr:SGNH/GDSL hydrolase family protein [Granulicella rosea]SNT32020.1 Phospholipase/lecithinase/hemolysin [Granulicella rosea]